QIANLQQLAQVIYSQFNSRFLRILRLTLPPSPTLFPYRRSSDLAELPQVGAGRLPGSVRVAQSPHARGRDHRRAARHQRAARRRSEEHTSELQSRFDLVCRLLLEKKKEH